MRTRAGVAAGLAALAVSGACAAPTSDPSPTDPAVVVTDAGPVRGTVAEGYRSFQAIPYAAPPVGELRWRVTQPVAPWSEPRDATRPGPACAQLASHVADIASESEDCLSLNVTVPDSDRPLPVMVWIHGGTGANGAGSFFDPGRLALGGEVVVVTVNHRLGIFGAFGHPGLDGSGTFGLSDQQAALRWVRRNIAGFGGDPDTVTVFGESHGAYGVTAHLVSPAAEGLFHRAALQSNIALHDYPAGAIMPGSPALDSAWVGRDELDGLGAAVAGELGCSDPATALDCLRALPAAALLPVTSLFTRYAYGTDLLPEDPVRALRAGRFHRVPVLSGATRDEHRLYTAMFYDLAGQPLTPESYPDLLDAAFGVAAAEVAARYPLDEPPGLVWSRVLTDRVWALATAEQNALLAAHVPTYGYEFADPDTPPVVEFPPGFPPGAHHAGEIYYQFDAPGTGQFGGTAGEFRADQRVLAQRMNSYWANFARTGDPNGPGLPRWEPFGPSGQVQALAPGEGGIRPVDYAAEHRLAFWRALTGS